MSMGVCIVFSLLLPERLKLQLELEKDKLYPKMYTVVSNKLQLFHLQITQQTRLLLKTSTAHTYVAE